MLQGSRTYAHGQNVLQLRNNGLIVYQGLFEILIKTLSSLESLFGDPNKVTLVWIGVRGMFSQSSLPFDRTFDRPVLLERHIRGGN